MAGMMIRDQINQNYTEYMSTYFPESDEGLEEADTDLTSKYDALDDMTYKMKKLQLADYKKKKPEAESKHKKRSAASSPVSGKHVSKNTAESETQGNKEQSKKITKDILSKRKSRTGSTGNGKNSDKKNKLETSKSQMAKLAQSSEDGRRQGTVKSVEKRSSPKSARSDIPADVENAEELTAQFDAFEFGYQEIITILEQWDRRKGTIRVAEKDTHLRKSVKRTKRGQESPHGLQTVNSFDSTYSESVSPEEAALQKIIIGIPLWVVHRSNLDDIRLLDIMLKTLKETAEIHEKESLIPDCSQAKEPDEVTYCHIIPPSKRQRVSFSNVFALEYIKKEDPVDQMEQSNITNEAFSGTPRDTTNTNIEQASVSRTSSKMEVKRIKASNVKSNTKKGIPSDSGIEIPTFKSRWLLNPGEKAQFKMKFFPTCSGEYSVKYNLEIVGWKNCYSITGQGSADIPQFNLCPRVIFPNVQANKSDGNLYEVTYFTDTDVFDFGAVLVAKPKEKKFHQVSTSFKLNNSSTIPAIVNVSFEKPEEKVDAFGFEPSILHIEVVCQGVKPDFEVDPTTVTFEQMSLYRKQTQALNLTNNCPATLIWRFVGIDVFMKYFGLSSVSGLLKYQEKQEILIEYVARKVQTINKMPLKLEVYNAQGTGSPVYTEVIWISAEAQDVIVEIYYAVPNEAYVNLESIKMGVEIQQPFQLKNRGKYDIQYRIILEPPCELTVPPHFEKILTVEPSCGTLPHGEKGCIIQVICKPNAEFQIKNAPLFKCYISDTGNKEMLVAVIPINVSISTHFSRFVITPSIELNFGAMVVGTKKTMNITIQNIGLNDFKYTVTKVVKETADESKLPFQKELKKRNGSKKTTDKSETKPGMRISGKPQKSSKLDDTPLLVGVFTVNTPTEEVKVGDTAVVSVDCSVESPGIFCEEIVICISEALPEHSNGICKQLMALGCVPTVDLKDVESIFEEHHICQNLSEFICPPKIYSYCVYVKDDGKLIFNGACVGIEMTARIRIRNKELVPCDITATVNPHNKRTSRDSNSHLMFTVRPAKVTVAPYSTEYFTIIFKPEAMETYVSYLEIAIDSAVPGKKEKCSIKLCGEGNIPQVAISVPMSDENDGKLNIHFQQTLLNEVSTKQFDVKNVGIISCDVILDLLKNITGCFSLFPTQETIPLMKTLKPEKPVQHPIMISIIPSQTASILVCFEPSELGCFRAEVKLTVVKNPFESMYINIYGESYREDITIEGLELPESKVWAQKRGEEPKPPLYHLDYGFCYIDKMKKRCFRIINHSDVDTYRFEWESHPNILFTPTVGHILPSTTKDIVATFLSSEPVNLKKILLKFKVAKIICTEKKKALTAWDDRQSVIKWVSNIDDDEADNSKESRKTLGGGCVNIVENRRMLRKIIDAVDEPDHEVIDGTVRDVLCHISAVADYTKYECSTDEIHIKDTLMLQSNSNQFTLKNIGLVPLEYKWQINTYESYPLLPSPLDVLEVTECPGQSTSHVPSTTNELQLTSSATQILTNKSSHKLSGPKVSAGSVTVKQYLISNHSKVNSAASQIQTKTTDQSGGVYKHQSAGVSDLFSRTADVSDRTIDTWIEDDDVPFLVTPESGVLEADEIVTCSVVFKPRDVFDYRMILTCEIPNLDPQQRPLEINLNARSLLPYCHFDFEESDYISSGRRDPSLPGPMGIGACFSLDPTTRVLEFKVLGIGTTFKRMFDVVNPTDQTYSFSWHDVNSTGAEEVTSFHCSTMKGVIERGKAFKMKFTFSAQSTGICESFWNFCIEEYNIRTPFLLVGNVTEPLVYFLTTNLNLSPTVIGVPTFETVTLANSEDIPLRYKFQPASLYSDGQDKGLSVYPMNGTIEANSETVIRVEFIPQKPGESIFNLMCSVKKLRQPLQLHVETCCYEIQPVVTCSDLNTKKWNLSPTSTNVIDFESIVPNVIKTLVFNLTNIGKCTFRYNWIYSEEQNKFKFRVSDKEGLVTSQSRVYCNMSLTFFAKLELKDFEVNLQILHGPQYKMLIKGSANKTQYMFSHSEYDFGPCLIQTSDTCFYTTVIAFCNNENEAVVLECIFENKPHIVVKSPNLVKAKETALISIDFRPRERIKYEETLKYIINSNEEKTINIYGEGVELKMMLVNPENKYIDFGSVPLGQAVYKHIEVINKSKATVTVLFGLSNQFAKCEDQNDDSNTELKVTSSSSPYTNPLFDALFINPNRRITVTPENSIKLSIKFLPLSRMHPFMEKICMQINDIIEPLCVIAGSCFGSEFCLDRPNLSFGPVVQDCTAILKISLINLGDIGSRFVWDCAAMGENFSLTPATGYCPPSSSVCFNVEFHPNKLNEHISCEVSCELENFRPLILFLTGSCVSLPLARGTIYFITPVRQEEMKNISISNKSAETWDLIPQVKGDFFSGPAILTVLPHTTEQYTVTYSPLIMTKESNHSGSVFFNLPDGQALLYELVGETEAPRSNGKIVLEIPCKTTHTELIPVKNWLQVPQRFKVITELKKSEKYDPVYKIAGNEFICVPANSESDYIFSFHSYRESNLLFKVTFVNEEEEYQFYDMSIKVVKCATLDTITMKTCVRIPVFYNLKLENPLQKTVNFTLSCFSSEIKFQTPCSVSANSTFLKVTLQSPIEYSGVHVYSYVLPIPAATEITTDLAAVSNSHSSSH
ncbi:hydrocephalus-inducing protein-like [Periplaneta americana]|uniref:hydrocephalus-inducing protein-like n=1 Tax=Periplaneta americana TaxID=6978 RepID=UPI0037E9324D